MDELQQANETRSERSGFSKFEPELWHFDAAVLAVSLCSLALGFGLT